LDYLWFSLEQNLFRQDSDGSKFTPPGSRFNNREGFDGGYTIEYVKIDGVERKMEIFDTVGRVLLDEAIPSKGQAIIEFSWSFNIPDYGADRMGIMFAEKGKVYQLAQWFPAICKFDDVNGWNSLPYLGQGEFYTDFGTYEVEITAPRSHVVCATGVLQNEEEVLTGEQRKRLAEAKESKSTVLIRTAEEVGKPEFQLPGEGPLTWKFKAEKVRNFAWTSSAATVWDAAAVQWEDGGSVLIQSVYPEESTAWTESTQMLRYSLINYSQQWFRYPYPTATNVNGVCGGMEYPMVLFCGSDRSRRGLHGVTSHELGHTWFPMVVNSDERRFPFMDEGFNTFINNYDRLEDFDRDINGVEAPEVAEERRRNRRDRRQASPISQPLNLPADQIKPFLLGRLAYAKPGQGLRMLREEILGPERFDPAFKLYIREWAFKSPQPTDFYRCIENATGMNLSWFWRGWFMEDLLLDQAIVSAQPSRDNSSLTVQLANRQGMVMPVILEIEFADGTIERRDLPVYIWYYTNLWTTEIATNGKKVVSVSIDSYGKFPDADRSNNNFVLPVEETKPEEKVDD
jgi:hypothetical protein